MVYFPTGVYAVEPVGSATACLVLNNGTTGASHIKELAAATMIVMSGPATDTTGVTHCKYCSLENLYLDGGQFAGTMIQAYYADNLYFRDLWIKNNYDICIDSAEFWDSRFYNLVVETSGSLTGDTATPNVLLRNSAASSGFGGTYSTAQDVIVWGPNAASTLEYVLIANRSATASVANGLTVSSPNASQDVVIRNVAGLYNTALTGAHVNFGTATGGFSIENSTSALGTLYGGSVPTHFAANRPLAQVAGAVSDAAFSTVPLDGTLGIDTLNKRFYLRENGGT